MYADRFAKGIDYRDSYGRDAGAWQKIPRLDDQLAGLRVRRMLDEYSVSMDSGARILLFRDRTLFHFSLNPDAAFFDRLRELMEMRGLQRLRILTANEEQPFPVDDREIGASFANHGFRVASYQRSNSGATWLVELQRE